MGPRPTTLLIEVSRGLVSKRPHGFEHDRDHERRRAGNDRHRRQVQTRHYHVRNGGQYTVPCEKLHQPDQRISLRISVNITDRLDPRLDPSIGDPGKHSSTHDTACRSHMRIREKRGCRRHRGAREHRVPLDAAQHRIAFAHRATPARTPPRASAISFDCMLIALMASSVSMLLQAPPTQSTDAITRSVIVDRGGFQAVRVTYAPGALVTPGPQGYDVVIVPIDAGMSAEVDGKPVAWRPGVTILIPRGAPHRVWNRSASPVAFISVRRLGDAAIKPPPAPRTDRATIVRSNDSTYVRATTFRVERDGELRSAAAQNAGPTLFVLAANGDVRMTIGSAISDFPQQHAGTVWMFDPGTPFALTNIGSGSFEVVRISAPQPH